MAMTPYSMAMETMRMPIKGLSACFIKIFFKGDYCDNAVGMANSMPVDIYCTTECRRVATLLPESGEQS